jgi:hypothetical protein
MRVAPRTPAVNRLRAARPAFRLDPARGDCRICGHPLEGSLVQCGRCLTPHHADCFRYNGRCSVYACGHETAVPLTATVLRPRIVPDPPPQPAAPPRSRPALLPFAAALAICILAGAVLVTRSWLERPERVPKGEVSADTRATPEPSAPIGPIAHPPPAAEQLRSKPIPSPPPVSREAAPPRRGLRPRTWD